MKSPPDTESWKDKGHNLWLHEYVRVESGCGLDAIKAGAGTLGLVDKLLGDFGRAVVDSVERIASRSLAGDRQTAFARGEHGETLHCTGRTDALVACYPGGRASYGPHLDNEAGTHDHRRDYGRCFTFVYYLNEARWDPERDGGTLRVFAPTAADDLASIDVTPIAGRIAIFRADTIVHAVQPAFSERCALTIWFNCGTREQAALAATGGDAQLASPHQHAKSFS